MACQQYETSETCVYLSTVCQLRHEWTVECVAECIECCRDCDVNVMNVSCDGDDVGLIYCLHATIVGYHRLIVWPCVLASLLTMSTDLLSASRCCLQLTERSVGLVTTYSLAFCKAMLRLSSEIALKRTCVVAIRSVVSSTPSLFCINTFRPNWLSHCT